MTNTQQQPIQEVELEETDKQKKFKKKKKSTKVIKTKDIDVANQVGDDLGFGINPDSQQTKRNWWPIFTPVLLLAQVGLFLACLIVGGFDKVWQNALVGPSQDTLITFGAKKSDLIRNNYQVWRFISAFILHSGILHLVMTMLWQLQVAMRIERIWGLFRLAPIYLLSGISGNLLSAVFLPDVVTVGPTSCICGLMGALLADIFINWTVMPNPWKSLIYITLQILAFLTLGLIPYIDNFAQIGGLIMGFFVALVLVPSVNPNARKPLIIIMRLLGIVLIIVYFAIFLPIFFGLVNFKCQVCYYLNPDWDLLFGNDL